MRVGQPVEVKNSAPFLHKGLDPARLAARNALMSCWMALPPERRNNDEVERIVRLLLDRCLAALHEDAALFEHPLR